MDDETGEIMKYTLDRDMADNLKLDASILDPRTEKSWKDWTNNIVTTLTNKYRGYIPAEKVDQSNTIADRIIITDPESFSVFWNEYFSEDKGMTGENTPAYGVSGVTGVEGQPIIINYDPEKWWKIIPQSSKIEAEQLFGNNAKAAIAHIFVLKSLTHEIIHQFNNFKMPRVFLEAGVRYYEKEVAKDLGFNLFSDDESERAVEQYQSLIDQMGDDIHKIFFGETAFSRYKPVNFKGTSIG